MSKLQKIEDERWRRDGERLGWKMPHVPFWKRLPIIRHIRAAYHSAKVEQHYALWESIGAARTGYDEWVLYGTRRGFERPPSAGVNTGE